MTNDQRTAERTMIAGPVQALMLTPVGQYLTEIYDRGLRAFLDAQDYTPQVFSMPYIFGVKHEERPDGKCYFRSLLDPLVEKLTPKETTEVLDGHPVIKWQWVKPPYRTVILASEVQPTSALLVECCPGKHSMNQSCGTDVLNRPFCLWRVWSIELMDGGHWHVFHAPLAFYEQFGIIGPYIVPEATEFSEPKKRDAARALISGWQPGRTLLGIRNPIDRQFYEREHRANEKLFGAAIDDLADNWIRVALDLAQTIAVSFMLLNAKNITAEVIEIPHAMARSRRRAGKPPGVTYRILRVIPFESLRRRVLSGASGSESTLAIHWVRGHFKRYGDDHRLFGKFSGIFWWQPHLAGKDRARRIEKSYRVETL